MIEIRRAEPADAGVLTAVAHAAKRHWGYAEELIELWAPDLTVTAETIRADPVYCAVADGSVVGFYALSRDGAEFELEHMWVDPRFLRGGIGERLFRHALDTVRSSGGASLAIASDPNAEGFYARMGARRIGVVAATPPGRELPLLIVRIDST